MVHNDHLGTPHKMTDPNQGVVWSAYYKPFGAATTTVSTITNNLRFPGQYFDVETGLNYNYYRDYDPLRGGYIESDPVGIDRGKNYLYAYAHNNPIINSDPFGLSVITVGCSSAAAQLIQVAAAQAEAASQTCLPCKDRDPFKNKMHNLIVNCTTTNLAPDGSSVCGYTYGGNAIYLTPAGIAGVPGCGCLKSTILHEVSHTIGYDESQARAAEKNCFSCSQ